MISSFVRHEWVRPGFSSLFVALNDDALRQTNNHVALTLTGYDPATTPRVLSVIAQLDNSSQHNHRESGVQCEVLLLDGTILHNLSSSFEFHIPFRRPLVPSSVSPSRSTSDTPSPTLLERDLTRNAAVVVLRLDMIGVQGRGVADEAVRHEVTVTMDGVQQEEEVMTSPQPAVPQYR